MIFYASEISNLFHNLLISQFSQDGISRQSIESRPLVTIVNFIYIFIYIFFLCGSFMYVQLSLQTLNNILLDNFNKSNKSIHVILNINTIVLDMVFPSSFLIRSFIYFSISQSFNLKRRIWSCSNPQTLNSTSLCKNRCTLTNWECHIKSV